MLHSLVMQAQASADVFSLQFCSTHVRATETVYLYTRKAYCVFISNWNYSRAQTSTRAQIHASSQPFIPLHSQKRQTPQLYYIALRYASHAGRWRQTPERRVLELPVLVQPSPHLIRQAVFILFNGVPQGIVSALDVVEHKGVAAEVWSRSVGGETPAELSLEAAGHGELLPAPDDTAVVGGIAEVGVDDVVA